MSDWLATYDVSIIIIVQFFVAKAAMNRHRKKLIIARNCMGVNIFDP